MDAKLIDDIKISEIKKSMEFEAKLGKSYAPEFVTSLAINAGLTLETWLAKNGAPKEAVDLLYYVIILERAAANLEDSTISDMEALTLTEEIPTITRLIVQMGGVFSDPAGDTYERENVITWQPPVLQPSQE
jgi:hypothetical protein